MTRKRKLAAFALAAGLALPVTAATAAATAEPAQAVPYKLAKGTWGGQCYYSKTVHSRYGKLWTKYRVVVGHYWWTGSKWSCRVSSDRLVILPTA